MKISKSKKELARIISENGGWREGAEWAAQDKCAQVTLFKSKPVRHGNTWLDCNGMDDVDGFGCDKAKNWHQTILSREEYFHLYPAPDADGWIEWGGGECPVEVGAIVDVKHRDGDIGTRCHAGMSSSEPDGEGIATAKDWSHLGEGGDIIAYRLHKPERVGPEYCESVMRSIPEPEAKPTVEQLAADYRNLLDFAERKQQEADAAKADAETKLAKLVAAGKALGLALSVTAPEPELVIADWRDLEVGDEVEITESHSGERVGKVGAITRFSDSDEIFRVRVHFDGDESDYEWISGWRFIRRP